MKSSDIRSAFLEFFQEKGHQVVASSSLVPADDPTLLFTNAGMNQFKDTFLGREQRDYVRATTSQKCVRAGGKHNDLENVGYTARHHTFFEMLGNFSFGDYFKREAIGFAWDFLTGTLGLPEEKLWITVYKDDQEAEAIWLNEMKVDPSRFSRLGEKDNFWSMGDTGPCGPCSEIFFDHGEDVAGDPPGGANDDGDRYIEIWNMVFMQYNRTADGQLHSLPRPSIDTGMGLERIAAVMQGVHSNYEIDLFQALLADASRLLGGVATTEASLRVIADHIRSCAFLIADGVMPSNEGRGYTLRRIIRRACRHGHKLGAQEPFFHRLVASLVQVMGTAYPQLQAKQSLIERTLLQEEEQFAKTLGKGMRLLEDGLAELTGQVIPGEMVFTLYDTYGFPVDLTEDIARERQMTVDKAGFEAALEAQRQRARAASKFGVDYNAQLHIDGRTAFRGYEQLQCEAAVLGLFIAQDDGWQAVDQVEAGESRAVAVMDSTPFYAESGGQSGDTGTVTWTAGAAQVTDTRKQGEMFLHQLAAISAPLKVGDRVNLAVAARQRQATALNHSATHLLHAALRQVLGSHVSQKGSLVNPQRLRFDFAHFEALKPDELRAVEQLVNEQIRANSAVRTEVMTMEEARSKGAMALFGEKYADEVRVLSMGSDDFSVELCGGTHARRTGDIGAFRIISESGIAAGVRRIEAVTGEGADDWVHSQLNVLQQLSSSLKARPDELAEKISQLQGLLKEREKDLGRLQQKLASQGSANLINQVEDINGVRLLAVALEGVDGRALRDMVDQLKSRLGSGVVLLAAPGQGRVALAAGVTADLAGRIRAGDLLKMVASQVGGKGGGRADFAQGAGSEPEHLTAALASIPAWLRERAQA